MPYTEFLQRTLYHLEGLESLKPKGNPDVARLETIRKATVEELTGNPELEERARLIRALLLVANDAPDEAHRIVKDASGDLAAYLHGIIHRREEDFDNARYWFSRAGVLPFFSELQRQTANLSEEVAKQMNWDPYLFLTMCERSKYGSRTSVKMLVDLQKAEFNVLLDYAYRAG